MRIGIDATALPPRLFGAGNYIVNLIRALPQAEATNEYVVFAKPQHRPWLEQRGRLYVVAVPLASRFLRWAWEQALLPRLAHQHRLDVLHSPHYTMPLAAGCTTVVTFHDMTFFLYPRLHKTYKSVFFRAIIRLSARRAAALIADSECTRRDIVQILRVEPDKATAVPLGVSPDFKPIRAFARVEEARRRYHLPAQIILFVGVLEPRKNLSTLIRAYGQLVSRGLRHTLVIVGPKGWMYKDLFRTVEALGLSDRVVFTGYVPEEDLALLYNVADVFVYPSFYEGFGLPVLESMSCGIPVVTSNVSSMPEIIGDAGILVNPRSAEELAGGLWRVLADRDLHLELARRGLERSRLFSWNRTASETLAVYRHVGNRAT